MTERLPFDPSRRSPRRTDSDPVVPAGATLSVRQVTDLVRGAIARHLPPMLHVLGEIGNLSRPSSGHVYFTLKDTASELACVMWRSTAAQVKFALEPGMEVIATGGIEVYAQRGSYQLVVQRIQPRGVGALELAFRQLRERLAREGLFDPQRKRPLPPMPQRIGLVTSPTGAAIRDVLHTLARRFPAVEVFLYPVRVQGEGAAAEIAAALRELNRWAEAIGGLDVILLTRGGGSLEDLWAFNEEVLARALVASRIPVVSAIGHEVDVTISDLVADVRAPTPTAAAELLTPNRAELNDGLTRHQQRMRRACGHALALARARLQAALASEGLARPLTALRHRAQRIDELQHRLKRGLAELVRRARENLQRATIALLRPPAGAVALVRRERMVERQLHRLSVLVGRRLIAAEHALARRQQAIEPRSPASQLRASVERLVQCELRLHAAASASIRHAGEQLTSRIQAIAAADPRAVLRRGYSITRNARTGEVIRSVTQVLGGLRLITQLADGTVRSTAQDPRQGELFK